MHGNGFVYNGNRMSAISMFHFPTHLLKILTISGAIPGTMSTLYMNATAPGTWQVICHSNEHQSKGMVAYYSIKDSECPPFTL